ncbi:trypsin-like serine peptidase [Methylomonas fluvii]|uniref:Trypsin-like peptidase domain-containing protein n=1 Tax=Methylomonas fluvii TaxID=1854564 RepID=A0ABR9DMG9_9GAMM|nr:trypsin-like peptidase domain-containing protein [Methylomonas fluvii]MBD9363097.1 trypsin-like peptidase domain-containing protein [Methylomonas fluvii]
MDTKLIAKILPTKKDGNRTIGTAYPIAQGLVLTARHVVVFDERDKAVPIVIEWPDSKHSDTNVTEIVWVSDEHDIAILRCQTPPNMSLSSELLAKRDPKGHEQWSGYGYPAIGKDAESGLREKIPVMGEFFPPNVATPKLTISCKSDALEKAGWCGLSGAPVFQGPQLFAIITETPQKRDECFTAVSIPWLIRNDQEFQEITGIQGQIQKHQKFVAEQKRQISDLLLKMTAENLLFKQIAGQLKLNIEHMSDKKLTEKLLEAFEQDDLAVLDLLLCAGADAFKQDSGESIRQNLRQLFYLFAGLMAPECQAIKQALINLPVRTAMAAELSLAAIYDTNPEFVRHDGKVLGRHTINADVFTRETGWSQTEFIKDATETIYKAIHKAPPPEPLDTFELEALNSTIKQRQNRSLNQLHRLELNRRDANLTNNPLLDAANCQALIAADCLPDLPIVHYGEAVAEKEAKLSAKITELFNILETSQPST